MTFPATIREAAAWYIARGMRPLPLYGVDEHGRCRCGDSACKPRDAGKHTTKHSEDRAKNGPDFDASDFTERDNLALMMGPQRSGSRDWLVALDYDVYQMPPWAADQRLPPTLRHTTPRGWHDIYAVPPFTPLGNWLDVLGTRAATAGFGLDLRYARGRIVAPPSRGYQWEAWREPAPLPRSFIERVMDERRRRGLPVTDRWDRGAKRA